MTDEELIRRFVDSFAAYDALFVDTARTEFGDPAPILVDPTFDDSWAKWQPFPETLPRTLLVDFYGRLPGPLPPLYEQLILTYRWAEVEIGRLRLLPNLSPGLDGLASAMTRDPGLIETLLPAGFVPFGSGPEPDYDPICFDVGGRAGSRECRVVKFDHEEILINRRLVEVDTLAPSFRRLVEMIVEEAPAKQP